MAAGSGMVFATEGEHAAKHSELSRIYFHTSWSSLLNARGEEQGYVPSNPFLFVLSTSCAKCIIHRPGDVVNFRSEQSLVLVLTAE